MTTNIGWTEPECQDEVKNKSNEAAGTVIAKYTANGRVYLDVRSFEERVYYNTLAENWDVTRTKEEIEGAADPEPKVMTD